MNWKQNFENWVMTKLDCRKLIDDDVQERYDQIAQAYAAWHNEAKMPKRMMQPAFVKRNFLAISIILDLKKCVELGLMSANKKGDQWFFSSSKKGEKYVEAMPNSKQKLEEIRRKLGV